MAPVRVLQLSDLHAGTREEPEVEGDLKTLVAAAEPELVVVSGDLTNRNRPAEHERAAAFLRSLQRPLLVVPGNHDIPKLPPWRFTRTFTEFLRVWGETEPTYRSERLVVCGLNSVRPWKQQGGALQAGQLERARTSFAEAPAGALRMAALHHHLLGAPWRTIKRTIANRSSVLGGLVDAGAELIVSGHVHQSAVAERREFEVARGGTRGAVVVTAPGLGQPRPKRRGEARGLHLYEAEERTLRVLTYAWAGHAWEQIADRRFPRGPEPLDAIADVTDAPGEL
jgi:3',5'-cyclic AMP phosphodiesterase CpdA